MTVVAFASAKFSPGVSTLAELVALTRPGEHSCLLVDCDPAGSEWVVRPGVAAEPGLVTLAMAGRRELAAGTALEHAQTVGALRVVVAPASARQAASALDIVGDRLGAHLAALEGLDVVVDCGRLDTRSPAVAVARAADLVVLVARPAVSDLVHVAPWVELLGAHSLAVALVGTGRGRQQVAYSPAEIADALGVPVLGVVADDPKAAARLFAGPGSLAPVARSRLARSAADVAANAFSVARASSPAPTRTTTAEEVRT
ncbi:MAG: chromosome partitioning protein [Acidimicrobiia bacterium]